ncbi:MAG: hypothetical protein NZ480_09730 [Bdellovibrionaceae bacterium]|nr:hypothetical protein [Pseudobdellovibrionaceae bacterium]MDW8190052.1 hypothetical protein [Pseudobdellovibrionaceae bacterium]
MVLFLIIFFSHVLEAKLFRNAYVSFELPEENWNCQLEQTEWVCRSSDPKTSREAIIILTAKEVGPTDSFEAYMKHLATPQLTAYRADDTARSQVQYPPKTVKINDHEWVDGLHLASEVPNYYTRYLATIKDSIAVLVTLSAHKDHYKNYSTSFFKTVQSLKVIATKNLLADPRIGPIRDKNQPLGPPLPGGVMPSLMDMSVNLGEGEHTNNKQGGRLILFIIAGALLASGLFLFLIKKKKK